MRSIQRTSSRRFTGAAVLTTLALACITGGMAGASPSAGPAGAHEPWIVYRGGHLGLVRLDGTGDHAILPDFAWYNNPVPPANWGHPMYPDWSPDGMRIAFNGDRGGAAGAAMPIWVTDAEGTDATELVPCTGRCQIVEMPAWSPDGRSIAYNAYYGPDHDPDTFTDRNTVEVMDLATGEARTILEARANGAVAPPFFWYPRWSPDSASLVLAIMRTDDTGTELVDSAIGIIAADGPADQEPRMLTEWSLMASSPDWHPTEDLIVFGAPDLGLFPESDGPMNLFTIRADGSDRRQLTTFAVGDERAGDPTWAPDGTRIVFSYVEPSVAEPRGIRRLATIARDGSDLQVMPGRDRAQGRLQPTR